MIRIPTPCGAGIACSEGMTHQISFSEAEFAAKKKTIRRE